MLNIIPRPAKIKENGNTVWFSEKTVILGEFSETLSAFKNLIPKAVNAKENTLTFFADNDIAKDGYKIICDNENINVFCSDKGGALYAFMTIILMCGGNEWFNSVTVDDKPNCYWRGFMLDCSRHFWSVDKIKQVLDFMASIKMNIFHWHLADDQGWRIEIEKYPLLTQKGTVRKGTAQFVNHMRDKEYPYTPGEYGEGLFYTKDDAREIVKYAAERNITVVPEIDIPGHSSAAIACYPEISCSGEEIEVEHLFGIFKNNLCCAKPATYDFVKTVIDELCEVFTGPYFHIGGDEVEPDSWDNCPDCQALKKEHNLKDNTELHGYFNNIIIDYLKQKGKKALGYNEILSNNLDRSAIPVVWTPRVMDEALEWAKSGGKTVQMIYDYVYADMPYSIIPLSKTYNYNPYLEGFTDEECTIGFEVPLWTEYVRDEKKFDFQTFVRLLAISEVSWTDIKNRNYENFEERLENLREFYKNLGINFAPKRAYCGNTFTGSENLPESKRKQIGRQLWNNNAYYELEMTEY